MKKIIEVKVIIVWLVMEFLRFDITVLKIFGKKNYCLDFENENNKISLKFGIWKFLNFFNRLLAKL